MKIRRQIFRPIIFALLACFLLSAKCGLAADSAPEGRLPLSEVVQRLTDRNAARAAALASYKSRRTYQLEYTGFPHNMHAELIVDLNYSAPDTEEYKVISETGPKWMVNLVLKRLLETEKESIENKNRAAVQITSENYDFTMAESQPSADGCSYVLNAEPKSPTKFLFRGRVWVDDRDFAVCKIEAEPAKNPSFWIKKTEIHHAFSKVGDFWLPAENTSVSRVRFDGRATLTIKYGAYEVQQVRAAILHATD